MTELSQQTKNLADKYKLWHSLQKPKEGASTIHVDEVASKVAGFYEKIRTVVDWQEEHLIRRGAIIRKLKRRFLNLELSGYSEEDQQIAEPLVLELIRGGHFANDSIEETKIQKVQTIIDKYIFILKNSSDNKNNKTGLRFYNWLLELAACEIEEALHPDIKENALIDYMFSLMKERIKIKEEVFESGLLKKEDADLQIYIACQQALFKPDKPMLSYNIIKHKYPAWKNADQQLIIKISENIFKIYQKIEKDLACPLAKKFYAICEKYDTPYLILGDILSKLEPETTIQEIKEPERLETLVKSAYKERLSTLKSRLRRAAVYSTASIFITKILSLLLLEIALSKIIIGHLDYYHLGADILIPTLLMLFMVSTIRPPSSRNLNMVIVETMKIVFQKEKIDSYQIKINKKRGAFASFIVFLFYLLGACISYGLIYLAFKYFNFPVTSIIINIIFIALIMFAGLAIRKRARELSVEDEKEGFLTFFSDILFLPIAGLGRWISNKWKKYNAIAAFFNALIDMPFSVFVEFIERWRYFIKEIKEDIR
jgi:hypothetical protein